MGLNWTATCARQHDPARRYITTQMKNGKRYRYQRCHDCDAIHYQAKAFKAKERRIYG